MSNASKAQAIILRRHFAFTGIKSGDSLSHSGYALFEFFDEIKNNNLCPTGFDFNSHVMVTLDDAL